jgi:hypothetical protein
LIAFQIGDGFIVFKSKEEDTYRLLFMPQKGEFANETTFVTSSQSLESANFWYAPIDLEFICASTDGIDHASLDKTKGKIWSPHQGFFEPLHSELSTAKDPGSFSREIATFLNSESFARITGDDKTVVLGVHQVALVDPIWNNPQPYRLITEEVEHRKKISLPNWSSSSRSQEQVYRSEPEIIENELEENLPKSNSDQRFILNEIVVTLAKVGRNNEKTFSFIRMFILALFALGLVTIVTSHLLNFLRGESSRLELYTHEIYLFPSQMTEPVGFLVINPTALYDLRQQTFEAWVYLPYSPTHTTYIDMNSRTAQIPSEAQMTFPIYEISGQQGLAANMPIGYLYPGTKFRIEEIIDSDRGNKQERRVKIRLILDRVK